MTWLILLVLVGSVVGFVMLKRGETLRFETPSTPRQVTMASVGLVATKRRWQTLSQGDGSANFVYHKGPNKLIALIGLLFFLVPGIVYIVLAGKKEALSVNTDDSTVGMTVVQVASNGFRGKFAGRALRAQLGVAPASLATTGQGVRAGSVASLDASMPAPENATPLVLDDPVAGRR
jgi:hypothetical protein